MAMADLRAVVAMSAGPPGAPPGGRLLGAARGVARWHPRLAPAMLAWPLEMTPDNHWVALA